MWLINNENRHNIELPPLMGMSRLPKVGSHIREQQSSPRL